MKRLAKAAVLIFAAATAAASAAVERDPAWIESRIRAWQPSERERRWETIRWAGSLGEALRLARQNHRPVFLYTHDGRLNVGRC